VEQIKTQIAGLEKRRRNVNAQPEIAAARARLQDARVALKLAQQQAAYSEIHAPIAGMVYGLAVRPGAYLSPGDLVANVGEMDRLRVRVYIDEPELGRVALGQPVTITWQALPDKQWMGTVEKKPTAIEALGSRQVGQVICAIENPGRLLIPGTNIDATIRTGVVEGALTLPKETLRHDASGDYVYLLKGRRHRAAPGEDRQLECDAHSAGRRIGRGRCRGDAVGHTAEVGNEGDPGHRGAVAMLFARVVETSERVTGTSKRLEKIELLATLLKQLNGDECEIAVAFLCGYTRQGASGWGMRRSAIPWRRRAKRPHWKS
jgi:multidrug efflux pump subunit AcrA (membrane-fusion protein)